MWKIIFHGEKKKDISISFAKYAYIGSPLIERAKERHFPDSKYHHQVRLIASESGGSQRKYLRSLVLKRHIVWIPKWIKMQ